MGARELLDDLTGTGFRIDAVGDSLVIRPWSKLTADMRDALRVAKPELLALLADRARALQSSDLSAVAWTEVDIARFLDRRARLLRWGWTEAEAERLAERLVMRDRTGDDRACCIECKHGRPGRCGEAARAGLHEPELGRDLVGLLQRCPGFETVG